MENLSRAGYDQLLASVPGPPKDNFQGPEDEFPAIRSPPRSAPIVGGSCGDAAALLWSDVNEYDLNNLVGHTDIHLTEAAFIGDSGEISALGLLQGPDLVRRIERDGILPSDGHGGRAVPADRDGRTDARAGVTRIAERAVDDVAVRTAS